ncbi:bifunctional riboflavin kinase/FAD synthetase [Gordonia alkaliphila]|uniref:bifunctional riboflavin kinase/FAD synthetase n=1 Tax=Gordonia alkaliphila TaxID=1053547 RepID=UPI001FF6D93B|nr:bifunctional riboflavin kinase/FAD synthetase [Gordonia alkaliphila]MCK0440401.1 bifunctional riboflavin kinase/FAD synthetase [Gordonia alkaliphila]
MLRWRGLENVPPGWGRCVVTIGVFDGVHRGHAQLIAAATRAAAERGIPSVLMTFDPHPSEVVRPGTHPPQLSTLHRRADLAQEMGIDVFCVIPFTPTLAAQSPEEFAHEVLVEQLHAAAVVVGDNFTFGHKALGDVAKLTELGERFGFEVTGVSLFGEHAVTYSSTYIRSCVSSGDVELAAEALGRPHRVEGVVVHGAKRGRDLGYPTANVAATVHAAIPGDGVYAAWFTVLPSANEPQGMVIGRRYPAAVSVGTNPTFSGRNRTVEAYILDVDVDVYGQHVAVDFVSRIRGMDAYDSLDALIAAIRDDVDRTRVILGVDD